MPSEKFTGNRSNKEGVTLNYLEKDKAFEDMREIAIKSIDPVDLMSIELNTELLDKNLNYNFEDPESELSSVVKNVIWGLWSDDDAKENLFPENLLRNKDEKEEDKKPDEHYDQLLREFIEDKEQHKTPEGRTLINFVILSIRSGFKGMSLKRKVEEHIANQLKHFLDKTFKDWGEIFYKPIKQLTNQEARLRVRLLGFVKDSKVLHPEIFSQYAKEGSMNVYGYFLRQLLDVDQAGAKVQKIMVGVIDKDFDIQRKEFLELLDKTRAESIEKTTKEKEIQAAVDTLTSDVAGQASAAHVSASERVKTISGISALVPPPAKVTAPTESESDSELHSGLLDDSGGEVIYVDSSRIPDPPRQPKSKGKSEYHERTGEMTDPTDSRTRVVPEPEATPTTSDSFDDAEVTDVDSRLVPAKPAPSNEPSDAIPSKLAKPKLKKLKPVPASVLDIIPPPSSAGKCNVTPPISGVAFKTPQPVEALQTNVDKFAAVITEPTPAPASIPKKERVENITVPALPTLSANFDNLKKTTFNEKLKKLQAEHPKTSKAIKVVAVGVVVAVMGVLGASLFRVGSKGESDSKKEKDRIASKSTTDDQSKKVIKDLPKDIKEPAMKAAMKAPIEVMKASKDLSGPKPIKKIKTVKPAPKPTPIKKVVDVKGAQSNPGFAQIDTKTINDLPDGTYKQMWEGKKFNLQGVSYSQFLKTAFADVIKKLPRAERYKATYAYDKEHNKLEKGWLIYNKLLEKKLVAKALTKEGLTEKETAQLKDWNDYQDAHSGRARQANRLLKKYEKVMKSKTKGKSYKKYKDLYARGIELMEFPGLNHLQRSADNVLSHEKVPFALEDGRVLKTHVRFAKAIKKVAKSFPMPDLLMGAKRGSIDQAPTNIMFAATPVTPPPTPEDAVVHQIDNSDVVSVAPIAPEPPQAFGSAPLQELKPVLGNMLAKKPPRIPKDARVYDIEDQDIIEEKMLKPQAYGSAPLGEFKPVLAKMMADRKRPPAIPEDALPKIQDEDIVEVRSATPPPIPVEDSQIRSVKDMAPVPKMYGSAPLPKEIKPILGVKPPAIPADAKPSVYDIPKGEGVSVPKYASITDDRMPKVGPPPVPAMADVPKEPKKKSLWGRAKGWLKRKVA